MTDGKRKILLADDEEDIKVIVQMYLETIGYDVVTAFDGLDAVEKAKEIKPDLILMDIMMPVIDGIEVTRQLKSQDETRDIPVVMLTAAAQSTMVDRAMKAGAADYISKPFEPDALKTVIDGILNTR
jgi:two-component system alkaline phosphatase synthesis response regulator PhoP/two-component system response regulator VicR